MADLDDIKDGKDFRTDQPQKNIPFTLKGCGALDWGMQSRLSRIFNPKTGKTVMLAFDHGYFQGPTTGLERIDINIAPLFEHADVLMCTRGILRSVVPPATNRPVVLRASGANSILAELSNEAVALSMDDAVRLNSCAVAAQVYIGSEYEHQSIKNIIQLVDAGMKVGMPTMAVTGVGKDMVRDQRYIYPDLRTMFHRLLIATVVGILAAFAVAGFRHAMLLLEWLFLNNDSGSLVNAATNLSPWRRLLTPALGGLAAGLLLMGWQKFTQQRPHAPTDYMEALQTDGQFDYAASLVKSLASLLVVTSGSAIGREGAMILLAALAASCFAQRFTPRQEWKLWIACGAAAGMAAAYRAPLAGSLFIAEVLFGTMMLASLGPVIISAVVALLVSNLINHSDALLYNVQLSVTVQARDYALIISTGVLAGLCGPLLLTLMNACHRGFVSLKLAPPWQLALGGLIVGLLSLFTPAVWGNGYSTVQSFLTAPPLLMIIAGIFLCKLCAVLASSGSGAPGGVFTPTLFIGLAIGMLYGRSLGLWFPDGEEITLLLGLTGMATLLAATTHAPIMSTLMICEMTGEYQLLPGLLIACVIASVISRTLHRDSIYRQHTAQHS